MTSQPIEVKPEVSVIVPVYNVEPYLRRCVDNLISQTLHNIEIILMDGGSTDGCGKNCDEYSIRDSRIRVIHQGNSGLSEARNVGIDRARADHLMFVCSDDWVEKEFCEIPLTIANERQADLVIFHHRNIKYGHKMKCRIAIPDREITQEEALNLLWNGAGMMARNKLYKDLFRTSRYPKGKVHEDAFLTPVLVREAKRIVSSSRALYNQEFREGSISSNLLDNNTQD